jgi:signal transduction histidine kinase
VRTQGLLALASGYLFSALIIVPHALTFPGVFAPNGLWDAGLQSTVWLYILWHMGLPLSAIAYASLKGERAGKVSIRRPPGVPVFASVATVVVLVAGLTWLVVGGVIALPPIMVDTIRANFAWRTIAAPPIIAISLTAIVLLWRRRSSVLDLWLLLVQWAWLIETMLLSTTDYRFSLVWYAGRIFGLLSSTFVLVVLLTESTMLYARLALSFAAREREREEGRLTTEVMVASIAHELHQPLSAILINSSAGARLLVQTPPDLDEVRATLEDIAGDGRHASGIIDSIRTMFSATSKDRTLIDVNELVRETLAILRTELKTRSISLAVEPGSVPLVQGQKGPLLQVLMNLITNAIDSMTEVADRTRLLRIQSTAHDNRVSLLVEDSGTGIDSENAKRIFEPFFTTKSHGMGLGLAICRSIIQAHGGAMSVTPGSRYGSVFRVDLPVAAAEGVSGEGQKPVPAS